MFADVTPYDLFREQFSRGSTPEAGMSLTTAESGQVQAYCWADSNIIRQRVRAFAFFVRRYNSRKALPSAIGKFPTHPAFGMDTCFLAALDPMPIPKTCLHFFGAASTPRRISALESGRSIGD